MEIIKIIGFITLIFGLLVGIHEFGHFMMAKFFGVWVQEFAIGFGPNLLSRKYGDTVYKLNLIPFGGYVKLYGEQDYSKTVVLDELTKGEEKENLIKLVDSKKLFLIPEDELEDVINNIEDLSKDERNDLLMLSLTHKGRVEDMRRYINKPIYARLFIVLGGVVMNFLMGLVTFLVYLLIAGKTIVLPNIVEYDFWANNQNSIEAPYISFVQGDKNKELEGSIVISINGILLSESQTFSDMLNSNWDKEVEIV